MPTIAERLLAGEHHGCATWADVARKLGCDERHLRVIRKTMAGLGRPVALVTNATAGFNPHDNGKRVTPQTAGGGTKEPVVSAGELRKSPELADAPSGTVSASRWPSVERFDRDCSNDGDSTCDRGDVPLDPIPECFTVREVASQIDADGNLEKQWLGARRDSNAFEEIQPSIPVGHNLRGVSTLVDERGNVRAQWIKTNAVNDERAQWLEAIRSVADELPKLPPVTAPTHTDDDLLVVLPVGDPHVGLLAWREDAGENFDLDIAERRLVSAFQHLIALAPSAAMALLILIGDNAHSDGQSNTTTKGTRVDVDGRTLKMARTLIRIARYAIDLSVAKFGRARMIVERGNHDELIAAMVALALSLAYEDDPRVEIDTSPEMFHWFVWGSVLIGTHHGDKVKPMDLLGVMAVDRQDDWSTTQHRRFYLGHYHHQMVKEVPGLICEYLPTLASSDAWHRSMGYRSQRALYMDVFHREHGHINRHIVGVGQLAA